MHLSLGGLFSPNLLTSLQGIDEGPEGLKLISDIIREKMGIDVSVLMGANIASEVAAEKFCETTIGEVGWVGGALGAWAFGALKRTFAASGVFCSGLFFRWIFRGLGIYCKEVILWNGNVSAASRMKGKARRPFGPPMIE